MYQWWSAKSQKMASNMIAATTRPIEPTDLKNVREMSVGLCILYMIVHFILRFQTLTYVRNWTVLRNPRCEEEPRFCNLIPTSFISKSWKKDVQTREIVSTSHGTSGCILPVVIGLALYLHPFCPFFVVVFIVSIQFVGFKPASSWFDRICEMFSMTSCILLGVQCLTEYARQLVPTSVHQMATSCICIAFYAILILFEAPSRLTCTDTINVTLGTPNPLWVTVDSNSMTETWQTARIPQDRTGFVFSLLHRRISADDPDRQMRSRRPDTG